jgi:hypothetical protein
MCMTVTCTGRVCASCDGMREHLESTLALREHVVCHDCKVVAVERPAAQWTGHSGGELRVQRTSTLLRGRAKAGLPEEEIARSGGKCAAYLLFGHVRELGHLAAPVDKRVVVN